MTAEITLDETQRAAVEMIRTAPVCVVTGGAGVGKTTCMLEALRAVEMTGDEVELCAPTGKAAKRLSEATRREARTIHRLLGWNGWQFEHDATDPLDADLVIVDEASMVDVELGAALMNALKHGARIAFVGDANQLPSVGPGRMLADLIAGGVPTVRLTQVHRAAAQSWVCTQSPRVLEGGPIDLADRDDFRWRAYGDDIDDLKSLAAHAVALAGQGFQILAPQRPGLVGIHTLNRAAQAQLNPHGRRAFVGGEDDRRELRVGDKAIHKKNDYRLGVFNGETGVVVDVNPIEVDFGDRVVEYDALAACSLRLAYALTIHSSQGSEWGDVAVVCHSTHTRMLTRQLLYTALTRAKKRVALIGNEKGLRVALTNDRDERRNTELAALIQERKTA
jgi:exodeoxyribonuclease V alpha subunit